MAESSIRESNAPPLRSTPRLEAFEDIDGRFDRKFIKIRKIQRCNRGASSHRFRPTLGMLGIQVPSTATGMLPPDPLLEEIVYAIQLEDTRIAREKELQKREQCDKKKAYADNQNVHSTQSKRPQKAHHPQKPSKIRQRSKR